MNQSFDGSILWNFSKEDERHVIDEEESKMYKNKKKEM